MALVAVIVLLALVEYMVFGFLVGRARGRYNVPAPAMAGHEVFDRYFRVHYNTLENLLVFVPAIWIFGTYVSSQWAAALGVFFIVGRAVYFRAYVADPKRRGAGFGLTMLANFALVIGALIGSLARLVS